MTPSKRAFDLTVAVLLVALLAPIMAAVAVAVLVYDGRPVLFFSERQYAPGRTFRLWKFRTMRTVENDHGVSGAHKNDRITKLGRILRRSRLDELPQLFNVIRGNMSFVGPRPPDPRYAQQYPEIYARVLASRPGISGLATVVYHKTEERLLAACHSAAETEAVYTRRCVPRKARLDLIYQANRSLGLDIAILIKTLFRNMPLH